ncbi:C1 family peptidase [Rubritalea sp.]|uniref:C1 family peptidase n=1 Tax=Rubritalea sp. TaxID=2109375 RepID=UPI003F4AE9CE
MFPRIAIFLILLLSSLHSVYASDYWKHKIDQGNVGSCHTFATLALVEAEYRKVTGKFINLSERELFARHYLKDYGSFDKMITSQFELATRQTVAPYYKESGHITDDFKLLQQHGVRTEKELPYSPFFKMGVPEAMNSLRHARHSVTHEMFSSRKSGTWNEQTKSTALNSHKQRRSTTSLSPFFTFPANTPTQQTTKQFCSNYTLNKHTPKTTAQAKQQIITLLISGPVAVDVSNYKELTQTKTHALYERHSFVVSHYHPQHDTFTIRSSTTGNGKQVDANALARGTYQIYHLERKK